MERKTSMLQCCTITLHFFLSQHSYSDCYRGNGKSYMGNLSKTRFGLTCSTWDKNI